jgi:hypothetical protein
MTSVKVHAEIDADGNLRLDVPVGLPAGKAEVVVVVQPEGNGEVNAASAVGIARSGLFTAQPAPDLDVDAAVNEMNQEWKSKLGL